MMLSFYSCNKQTEKQVDLIQVMNDIENTCLTEGMMELTENDLMSYYGIVKDDVVKSVIKIDSSGIKADEIVMIEAKDLDTVKIIEEKLNQRLKQKANEARNYLPDEYAIIIDCQVKTYVNYVTLFVSGQVDEMYRIFKANYDKQ